MHSSRWELWQKCKCSFIASDKKSVGRMLHSRTQSKANKWTIGALLQLYPNYFKVIHRSPHSSLFLCHDVLFRQRSELQLLEQVACHPFRKCTTPGDSVRWNKSHDSPCESIHGFTWSSFVLALSLKHRNLTNNVDMTSLPVGLFAHNSAIKNL